MNLRGPTKHVANVDDNWSSFGWEGREGIADGVVIVAFAAGANFESIFTIPLEEQCQTPNISVVSSSPRASGIFRSHIMDHAHLSQVVLRCDIHCLHQVILGETKADREAIH